MYTVRPPLWHALVLLVTACSYARVANTPAPAPAAGSPIRYALRSAPTQWVAAKLVSLDPDTLAVERFLGGRRWVDERIGTDSVAVLQARVSRRGNGGRGALIGGLVGAALGSLCALNEDAGEWLQPSAGQCLVFGVTSGAGTGLLIGALSHTDLWAPVRLPTRGPEPTPLSAPLTTANEADPRIGE